MLDLASKDLRNVFSKFATGVTAITFKSSKNLNLGITINSYTSLSLNPPMILWCLGKESDLYEEIIRLDKYIINFLSEEQKNIANALAKKNDHIIKNDLFLSNNNNIIIKDSLGWLLCSKNKIVDAGDHSILIANVIESKVLKGSPLIFWNSDYKYIGE